MSATNYLESWILGHVLGGTTFAKPSKFLALYTTAPGETGGGVEVSGGSYARQSVAFTVSGTTPTQAANTSQIDFPAATASWGNCVGWAVVDASTGGNILVFGTLTASKTISSGDILRIPAGAIVATMD